MQCFYQNMNKCVQKLNIIDCKKIVLDILTKICYIIEFVCGVLIVLSRLLIHDNDLAVIQSCCHRQGTYRWHR